MKITKYNKGIWSISKVLAEEICKDCIDVSNEDGLFPNSLNEVSADIHNSLKNRVFLTSPELAKLVWDKISTSIPQEYFGYKVSGLNENFRFYKYLTGQEFKTHQDVDFYKGENEKSFYSILIYLNDNFLGGETCFENISFKPRLGSALLFPHTLFHSGAKIIEGEKFVLRSDILYKIK